MDDRSKALESSTTLMPRQKIQTTAKCDGPETVGEIAAKVLSRLIVVDRPVVDVAARKAEIDKHNDSVAAERRFYKWSGFLDRRGGRYLECRLTNFKCDMPKQTTAINKLTDYVDNIRDRVSAGDGIVLYGARGTGKDHLAVAVCREAIRNDVEVHWVNGMEFFGQVRDALDDKKTTEYSLISALVCPSLLYISDPLPPSGALTDFQQAMLFRVLDARYSQLRPCIMTVNAANGKELDERLGGQNADRIRHGALAIHCDWPSYRKVQQ